MTKIEWAIVVASLCGVIFTGWQSNNGYRYVNAIFEKAKMCEKTNCETLVATNEMMAINPPQLLKDKKAR